MMFPNLFKPGQIGKMKVRNRTVFAAILSNSGDINGSITPQTIHHYIERARGGVGLITVEINYTEPVSELENKLRDKVREPHIVGDSYEPRQILDAVSEGFRVARII